MKSNLSSYINLLRPFIQEELISEPYLYRIEKISEGLPVLSLGSFECWLGSEKRIDFNLSINPRINEHIKMKEWLDTLDLKKSEDYVERMTLIRNFCEKWSKKDFFLKAQIGELSLVYDVQNPDELNDVPWLYISFLPTLIDSDPNLKASIIIKTLGILDPEINDSLILELEKILCLIPSSVRVSAIGLSRKGQESILRIYSKMKSFEEILEVLQLLNWPGKLEELSIQMEPWIINCAGFGLALDFNGEIMEKVGIECHFPTDNIKEHLSDFTQKLCKIGACTELKRNALIKWNGTFNLQSKKDFWSWPDRLQENDGNDIIETKIKRSASFIKLIFEPGKPMYAKAYPIFIRPVHR